MKKRIFLFTFTIILIGIAIGLFYLQNVYLPKINAQQKTVVYIANKELNPLTDVNKDNFVAILLPSTAISSDYVLDISKVVGSPLKNTIYEKEILSYSHIAEKETLDDKNLLTAIVPNYYDDIKADDLVNIYVIKADKKTNIFSMENIFIAKKVEKVTNETSLTNAKQNFSLSVELSEVELKSYYAARHAGEIVATKITNPNLANIASTLTPFNPSEIVFNNPNVDNNNQPGNNVESKNDEHTQETTVTQ